MAGIFDEIDLCIDFKVDQDTSESFLMNNTVSQQFLALEKGTWTGFSSIKKGV